MTAAAGQPAEQAALRIRRFDPRTMGDHKTVVILGRRGTGKSVLLKDLMSYKKHIPAGVVMSGTEEGNGFFGSFIPELFIYNDFDPAVVQRVIARQRAAVQRDKEQGVQRLHNVFLVMDDCMFDKSVMRHKCMRQVFMNGRHWHMLVFITAQYMMDLGPDIRNNIDWVFVLRDNIIKNRQRLYDNFFGMFASFQEFCEVMDACTSDNMCLVLDNSSKSNRIEDTIFFYKASPDHDSLRLCAPAAWALHERHYDPRHGEDDEPVVSAPRGAKARASAITVRRRPARR